MTRLATALFASLILGAPVALAQETTTGDTTSKTTETQPAKPADEAKTPPAAAETQQKAPEQQAQEQLPAPVVKDKQGDWDIVCSPDSKTCIMAQKGFQSDGKEIMEVRIRRIKERTQNNAKIIAAIQVAVPIGVMLQPGLALQIDGGKKLRTAYRSCNPQACLVQEPVDEGLISAMKKGAKATFTLVAPPDKEIPIDISLSGFTAGFNELTE